MSFIVISKELFRNPRYDFLSAEAKLLYGLLKDRCSLSQKNGEAWINKDDECFIYFSQNEVMRCLGCRHDKASKLMRELEKVGLIRRIRQGLGKPHMVIVNEVVQSAINKQTGGRDNGAAECGKTAGNNTYDNKIDINNTELARLRDRALIEHQIKMNISYSILAAEMDRNVLDSVIAVIVEVLCQPAETIRIAGEQKSISEVYRRFMALDDMHLRYIVDRFTWEDCVIASPKGYILKYLFYADQEMDIYYASRVAYDEKNGRNNL